MIWVIPFGAFTHIEAEWILETSVHEKAVHEKADKLHRGRSSAACVTGRTSQGVRHDA
ncbi:hypothetical protein [Pacificibacter maritimus]|uniref:hypothetical protein n=1 Tax=Pacificibacter maritimus TaxID=762213 RepID=UPI0014752B6F|nr:hypothetical protein [Pacificibacter maritimus]